MPVSKQSNCPIPSRRTEKLLPSIGIHSASAYNASLVLRKVKPATETMKVNSDDTSAHVFTLLSDLMKKDIAPHTNGTTMSNTGIINYFLIKNCTTKKTSIPSTISST